MSYSLSTLLYYSLSSQSPSLSLFLSLSHSLAWFSLLIFVPFFSGHLVCYKAPWVFKAVFEGFKIFLDAKTVSKVVFVYGDHSDGSETDVLMQKVIGKYVNIIWGLQPYLISWYFRVTIWIEFDDIPGPEWRVLTGAAQPVLKPNTSPGYNHAVFWPK